MNSHFLAKMPYFKLFFMRIRGFTKSFYHKKLQSESLIRKRLTFEIILIF